MQLGRRTPPPAASELASALDGARRTLGHRPAVTLLRPEGREEQGVASLAQWAAKGAHLLEVDLDLEPGDRLMLDAPLSWTSAAVCLAAWWAGVAVLVPEDAATPAGVGVAVVHESRPAPPGVDEVLWLGDDANGAPLGAVAGEPWVRAVQAFPDHPPAQRAASRLGAIEHAGRVWTHAEVIAAARGLGDGTLGLDAATVDPVTGLVAVAARPVVTGHPTVILAGVERDAAAGDRVATWR